MNKLFKQTKVVPAIVFIILLSAWACKTSKDTSSTKTGKVTRSTVEQNDSLEYYRKQSLKSTVNEKLLPAYKTDK